MGKSDAVLLLEDGSVFYGEAIGKPGVTGGEICFNTGMTGYQEIYTDPSYFGQIIVNTHTHIGNYGVLGRETESDRMQISGLAVNVFSEIHSRKTAESSLQQYLEDNNVTGIAGIDTRKLVRQIRTKGAMNAAIATGPDSLEAAKAHLKTVPAMKGLELSSKVSAKTAYTVGDPGSAVKIAALDLGIKTNIVRCLVSRGCFVKVFPHNATFADMQQWGPHGYFLSNGPGDPATMDSQVAEIKKILEKDIPLFGICLGQQLLARACGIGTYKMHHGHRGLNHPVKNLLTGKSEITSQNHGFSIDEAELKKSKDVETTHINLNDNTVEGIRLKGRKAFSVQYHPESSPGPHDSRYLFDSFVGMVKKA